MSVTICSEIIGIDALIPNISGRDREDKDVQGLIPWVFKQSESADENDTSHWPKGDRIFNAFFNDLYSYRDELEDNVLNHTGISRVLVANETIDLPRKNWRVSEREYFRHFEGPILRFTCSGLKFRYTMGGKQYASRAEGAAFVGQPAQRLPVLSFTGWYEGQTWNEFLMETVSIMLGQLTKSLEVQRSSEGVQGQEVFVAGFHGFHCHIACAWFAESLISRVHAKGCSENEVLNLQFTRGYNLCLKEDWLETTRALTRLLRYLLSGRAKVSAIQACM
ncbi:uncharacterized protein KD926_003574 [Aspergillus affinis]|uniref:uncharacterized protein n=1 Tax=Aspergillus affinis TaxID=1070780 RepID=UPI0022FE632D|nr:uncharacterized protein KD926_003574 [Aspergillus affinis]KAI9043423.1 hypothetical protein KD926_003574 [Aspergillus affinis]